MSAVVLENCLYVLGGYGGRDLDTVQELSLDSLSWELIQLKLPQAGYYLSCFRTDTKVYLVINETLYSFTPLQVKAVKTLGRSIRGFTSYYSRGTLYWTLGGVFSLVVGKLT
jgi:hypothetical protein